MTTTHEAIDIQTSDGPMAAHVYRPATTRSTSPSS